MGKYDPSIEAPTVSVRALDEWTKHLIKEVRDDEKSRTVWLTRQAHFLRRRYAREFKGIDFPWPNAADIVMPVMDMAIERLKPVFVQSTLGTRPVVTLLARRPEFLKRVPNLETFMDWLVETRIPNFAEEVTYGADHYLQHGFCVFKVWYDYRTRKVREVIDRSRLPEAVQLLLPRTDIRPEDADEFTRLTGHAILSRTEARRYADQLRPVIRRSYNLDASDPDDKKAEEAIVKWLTTGSSDDAITIKRREVWRDTPRITAIQLEDLIVAEAIGDLQDAKRITHRIYLTEEELQERARDAKWSKDAVAKLTLVGPRPRSTSINTQVERARELAHSEVSGLTVFGLDTRNELYEVWEVYTYLDIDGDGFSEKVVATIDPNNNNILRIIELPFKHGMWPFVQIKQEYNDKRFYHTRGIPEKLDDLDVEITAQHRAKLNRMTIANAPMFMYRLGSTVNPAKIRFIPGQGIPVTRPDDIVPINFQSLDISYEREEQILEGWVEKYLGVLDTALAEQGRLTRPRSATEVQSTSGLQAQISGARILLWQRGMAKIYRMLWDLWVQFGPDEVYFRVTGADASEPPIHMNRYEMQGEFDFVPTPSALNNPILRMQQAQAQLNMLIQVAQLPQGIGNGFELNVGEAVLNYLEQIDSRRAKLIIRRRTPQEIQQIQAQQAPQLPAQGSPENLLTGIANLQEAGAKQGAIG